MFNLITSIIILCCLGAIIFILARKIPKIQPQKEPLEFFPEEKRFFGHSLEELDIKLNKFFERSLRRLRVLTMKCENFLSRHLMDLKEKSSKPENKNGISEVLEEKNNGNGVLPG